MSETIVLNNILSDRNMECLDLICKLYQCSSINEYRSCCCMNSELKYVLNDILPQDLIAICQDYALQDVICKCFLTQPVPNALGVIQCLVRKQDDKFRVFLDMKSHPDFVNLTQRTLGQQFQIKQTIPLFKHTLYSHSLATIQANRDLVLMSGNICMFWKKEQYTISSDCDVLKPIAFVQSNFTRSEFTIKQKRDGPDEALIQHNDYRAHNLLWKNLRMKILVPHRTFKNMHSIQQQHKLENQDHRLTKMEERQRSKEIHDSNRIASLKPYDEESGAAFEIECYETIEPVWDDTINEYRLRFDHYRIQGSSAKNFKLIRTDDLERRTVLQFGQRQQHDDNEFVLDVRWPLSPLQAFAICLTRF